MLTHQYHIFYTRVIWLKYYGITISYLVGYVAVGIGSTHQLLCLTGDCCSSLKQSLTTTFFGNWTELVAVSHIHFHCVHKTKVVFSENQIGYFSL